MDSSSDSIDRLPPHSIEAEQGVLGCIMLQPDECIGDCIEKFRSGPSVFYDLRHRTVYEAMLEMHGKKAAIDLITLQQLLKDRDQLEGVGGLSYLASLPDGVPSAANLPYYIDIVHDRFILRTVIATCTEIVGRAYDLSGEVPPFVDYVDSEIKKAVDIAQASVKTFESSGQVVERVLDLVDEMHLNKGKMTGIPTGFIDLDKMTGGLQPKEMIIIAGRTAMGKTSLAMNIAENAAMAGHPVGVFSLEMSSESLMLRMICSRAKLVMRDVRSGDLVPQEMMKFSKAAGKIGSAPIYVDDTRDITLLQLKTKARRMHKLHGIKLVVVDYLQLVNSGQRSSSREQEVAIVSKGLRALAGELGIPVVALAQLNRESDKDKKRKPRLSDLRESGSIEQDADVVAMLYKPDEEDEGMPSVVVPVNLLIAKQRHGATGDVNLVFIKQFTSFQSAAKIDQSDVPDQTQFQLPHPND
jgi:replicative DNA helicase